VITLRENEKLIKMVRQHRSVMAGTIVWSVALAGLAIFALLRFRPDIFGYSLEIIAGIVLVAALTILHKIYIWRKNSLIITDQRIVLNERQGIFSRTVTEFLYGDIYDISFKQVGLAALLNKYGKLIIRTPSKSETAFDKVPSPAEVVEIINKIRDGRITDFVSPEDLRSR